MPRATTPEKLHEYAELLKFLNIFSTYAQEIPLDADYHPGNVSRRHAALGGVSRALAGLRQAINDILEQVDDWPPQAVKAYDDLMQQHSVVTVSELRRRSSRVLRRIVKRNRIKSETEYYLVKGIVEGCGETMSKEEHTSLPALLLEFEMTAKKSAGN